MDGKVVGFFNNPKYGTSLNFMRAPDDIFTEVKVKPPSIKIMAVKIDWANGNKKKLWVQCTNHLDIEVRTLVHTPLEWTSIFYNKDLTPAEGLMEIDQKVQLWEDDEVVNIQPLLNWLRVAGCKER